MRTSFTFLAQLFCFLIGRSPEFNLSRTVDLPRLLARHSLLPLIKYRQGLWQDSESLMQKSRLIRFVRAYEDFAAIFRQNQRRFLTLKGLSLIGYYPSPELRPFSDLDFLLYPSSQKDVISLFDDQALFAAPPKARAGDYQVSIRHKATGCVAEIHSALGEAGRGRQIARLAFDQIATRTLPDFPGPCRLNCLSAALEFIYLCHHFVSHGLGAKFLWLCDLYFCLRSHNLDVTALLAQAGQIRCDKAVLAVLHLLWILTQEPDLMLSDPPRFPKAVSYAATYLEAVFCLQETEKIFRTRLAFTQGLASKVRLISYYCAYFPLRRRCEN